MLKYKMQIENDTRFFTSERREMKEGKSSYFLVTVPYGIGDAVYLGLSVVDQILRNMPETFGRIDFLCNTLQSEILSCDPRLNKVIVADRNLFPTQDKRTLSKMIFSSNQGKSLQEFLRERRYLAVFPGNAAFGFLRGIGSKILLPNPRSVIKDVMSLRRFQDAQASRRARSIINEYFNNKLPTPEIEEEIPLYINLGYYLEAKEQVNRIKRFLNVSSEKTKLMMVATDTTSDVTRPSRELLEKGIGRALEKEENLVVYIFPSYSDPWVSDALYASLLFRFGKNRITLMPANPKQHLLYITALISEADIFLTGDTGLMHLAATEKKINGNSDNIEPENKVKIIAVFGGTNPGLYGYPLRTTIVGRGRKDQKKFRPGFIKEGFDPKGRNYFDHIEPQEITAAILKSLN